MNRTWRYDTCPQCGQPKQATSQTCDACYKANRRIAPAPSDLDRFWSKVDYTGGMASCWPWLGSTVSRGYGLFSLAKPYRKVRAHRHAYELVVGPIPDGLTLDHLCRNRACVNPMHLEPVTSPENTRRGSRAAKTHCVNGHPFDEVNTYRRGTRRYCRECMRAYQARKRVER